MPRHWHRHGPVPPVPPIPPIPPIPPFAPDSAWFGGFGRMFEDFDFDMDLGERHGHGRHRKRMFGGGELRLVLLKLIADEPRHGYQLIKALEELTGGAYSPSPGVVYPTLSLLDDEGLIREQDDASARKLYAVTDAGRAELEARAEEVEKLMARLSGIGDRKQRRRSPELGRALANFGRVVANRFREGKFDSETIEDIVDIIDEAAKRIERL